MYNRASIKFLALPTLVFAGIGASRCRAGFMLGSAADYAVLYEGIGGHNLQFNNGSVHGNVGVGGTGHVQDNSPLTIYGGIDFAAANSGQYGGSGTTVTGPVSYNVPSVTSALSVVNSLSNMLGAEAGTNTSISGNLTISASSGKLDANGNRVFNVTSMNFVNGDTLTIAGDAANDSVVFNFGIDAHFGGAIYLTGGLTPSQVLYNFADANAVQISTNGAPVYGTFLDPNGKIQMNHSVVYGNLYGGGNQDMQVVSGVTVYGTGPGPGVPEPTAVSMAGAASSCLLLRRRRA